MVITKLSDFERKLFDRIPLDPLIGISKCSLFLLYNEPALGSEIIDDVCEDENGPKFVLHPRSPGLALGYIYKDEWINVITQIKSLKLTPYYTLTWPAPFTPFPPPTPLLPSTLSRVALLFTDYVRYCIPLNPYTLAASDLIAAMQPLAATPELDHLFVLHPPTLGIPFLRARLHLETPNQGDGWFQCYVVRPGDWAHCPLIFADAILYYHRHRAPLHAAFLLDGRDAALVTARDFLDVQPSQYLGLHWELACAPSLQVKTLEKHAVDADDKKLLLFLGRLGEWVNEPKLLLALMRRIQNFHEAEEVVIEVQPEYVNDFKLFFAHIDTNVFSLTHDRWPVESPLGDELAVGLGCWELGRTLLELLKKREKLPAFTEACVSRTPPSLIHTPMIQDPVEAARPVAPALLQLGGARSDVAVPVHFLGARAPFSSEGDAYRLNEDRYMD